MRAALGIDIGGTNLKAAAVEADSGEILARRSAPTRDGEFADDGMPAFAAGARTIIRALADEFPNPVAVGVSSPGLVEPGGVSVSCLPAKMRGMEGLDWRAVFGLGSSVRFGLLNDAHAALAGERAAGAARGLDDVVMLTLGTGVGGAILSGGRILTGHIGRAGHLGHISLDPAGPPDDCGTPGSLEDAVGNRSVAARSGGKFADTRALLAALDDGDADARRVWQASMRALGAAIVSFINALDPQRIVIGGGISVAGERIFGPLRDYLAGHEWRPIGARVEIVPAQLGEWAGAIGAAWHAAGRGR